MYVFASDKNKTDHIKKAVGSELKIRKVSMNEKNPGEYEIKRDGKSHGKNVNF